MSTRAVIGRTTGSEGEFAGVYSHWDGYPTALGRSLFQMLHGHFHHNLAAMLNTVIDAHPAGWSTLVNRNWRKKPGYPKDPRSDAPACYCHGMRHEKPQVFTHENIADSGCEWLYIFDEEKNRMVVRDLNHGEEMIVELGQPEPDWKVLECGEKFERCSHYAWYHDLAPKTSNLSTQTFLGRREFEMHDAVAFIVDGKRYRNTGSGRSSNYVFRGLPNFPPDLWIATVARNRRRRDIPVAKIQDGKYTPYPGVSWVMPRTRDNPNETVVLEGA